MKSPKIHPQLLIGSMLKDKPMVCREIITEKSVQ